MWDSVKFKKIENHVENKVLCIIEREFERFGEGMNGADQRVLVISGVSEDCMQLV